MIQAELAGDAAAFRDAVSRLPFGLRLNERPWDAFARYAFVEYSLLFPLNDFTGTTRSVTSTREMMRVFA
jgi:hypothetical protein